jgi:spore coat polysaccharide biosynthesis protein SpsF
MRNIKQDVGIIIFSRMDSNRLPGKALIDISGRVLLGRVIDRAKHIKVAGRIIVATSLRPVDDQIAYFAESEGISVYRGDVDDVAGRALEACKFFGFVKFARICGDRPFFDPKLVSNLLIMHEDLNMDIVTTMFPRTFPPGLTTEIISTDALGFALTKTDDPVDREHITNYFYKNPQKFKIHNVHIPNNSNYDNVRLVVDNEADLLRARWIGSKIQTTHNDVNAIVSLAKEWENTKNIGRK